MSKKIITTSDGEIALVGVNTQKKAPKIKAVHPFGSKILVEVLSAEETIQTSLFVSETAMDEGAPQAYIIEVGPGVSPETGIKVGQRIYWSGKGTSINDPRSKKIRALLEVHNIQGLIEEEV